MVNKKIKKSESTLAGITFGIIIAIGIFTAMFLWMQTNAEESGVVLNDPKYNDSYNRLVQNQDSLNNTIEELKNNANNIVEPDSAFGVAWNGLKGLVNVFKVPLQMLSIGYETLNIMTYPLTDVIPRWLLVILQIGLVAFIIFVIVSIFKGDNNVIR